jgi:hypothetical protein
VGISHSGLTTPMDPMRISQSSYLFNWISSGNISLGNISIFLLIFFSFTITIMIYMRNWQESVYKKA